MAPGGSLREAALQQDQAERLVRRHEDSPALLAAWADAFDGGIVATGFKAPVNILAAQAERTRERCQDELSGIVLAEMRDGESRVHAASMQALTGGD